MKNVAGYDVSRLIAGSLGVLGVICEVSLKVLPVHRRQRDPVLRLGGAAALSSSWRLGRAAAADQCQRLARRAAARALRRRARRPCAAPAAGWAARRVEPDAAPRWWASLRDQRQEFFALTGRSSPAGNACGGCRCRAAAAPLALPGGSSSNGVARSVGGAPRPRRSRYASRRRRSRGPCHAGPRRRQVGRRVRAAEREPDAHSPRLEAAPSIRSRIFNPGRLYAEL